MNWAIRNIRYLKVGTISVSVILAIAHLAVGPEPFSTRLASVAAVALAAPVFFFYIRWVSSFSLRMARHHRGLRSWVLQTNTVGFYFGAGMAALALVSIVMNIGKYIPLAWIMFIAAAVISYSSLDAIRRFRGDGSTTERAG